MIWSIPTNEASAAIAGPVTRPYARQLAKRLDGIGEQDVSVAHPDAMFTIPLDVDFDVIDGYFAQAEACVQSRANRLDFLSESSARTSLALIASIYAQAWTRAMEDIRCIQETGEEKVARDKASWAANLTEVDEELKLLRAELEKLEKAALPAAKGGVEDA